MLRVGDYHAKRGVNCLIAKNFVSGSNVRRQPTTRTTDKHCFTGRTWTALLSACCSKDSAGGRRGATQTPHPQAGTRRVPGRYTL